ncbi:hypothetical protein [Sediminibacterium ginsengisoli]|nr:hypothetical protein [Sediminibacterium ginsengisoli]
MKKQMPFDFILNYLPRNLVIQPAIGMFYIYCHQQIVLIARQTAKNKQYNGLWIATNREDHVSLKAAIPALSDFVFDKGEGIDSAWLLLSEEHDDFERAAAEVCELISKRDKKIGRVTKKSQSL